MNDENVITPDDSRFELPDVEDLYGTSTSETVEDNTSTVEPGDVSTIDPYQTNSGRSTIEEPETTEETVPEINNDALHQYLRSRGISDTTKIQYEDEDGNDTEVNFDTLSTEEQLNIINELSKPNITDEEIQTIDYLRRNNMNLAQVVDYFANQRLQQYINENGAPQKTYAIDEYSDDDLYVADLLARNPKLTQEKVEARLEAAKADEETYKEEVAQLRENYKAQEQQQLEYQQQQEQAAQEQYRNTLYSAINDFNEIALDYRDEHSDTLEIEAEDKRKALSYLLDTDAEGKSQFVRDIENPDALVELAWLRTSGADALADQSKYYKDVISERNKEIARLNRQIEKLKTNNNSVVVPAEPKRTSKNSSSPWDTSGLL